MFEKKEKTIYVKIQKNLYKKLFEIGGDRTIAYYVMLKHYVGDEVLHPFKGPTGRWVKDNQLLAKKLPMAAFTIRDHHRKFAKSGAIERSFKGVLSLLSDSEIHEKYGRAGFVQIKLGKDIIETSKNVFLQRVEENIMMQKEAIALKKSTLEILQIPEKDRNESMKRVLKNSEKFFKRKIDPSETVDETIVMSAIKLAQIKNPEKYSVSMGKHLKKKLKASGDLETKRRFTALQSMNWKEYSVIKKSKQLKELFPDVPTHKLLYAGGYLCQELVSEFILKTVRKAVSNKASYVKLKIEKFVEKVEEVVQNIVEKVSEIKPFEPSDEITIKMMVPSGLDSAQLTHEQDKSIYYQRKGEAFLLKRDVEEYMTAMGEFDIYCSALYGF